MYPRFLSKRKSFLFCPCHRLGRGRLKNFQRLNERHSEIRKEMKEFSCGNASSFEAIGKNTFLTGYPININEL